MNIGEVHPLREVLSKHAIGGLVGATLPRVLWITEEHVDVGYQREALMVRHLLAAVPGE